MLINVAYVQNIPGLSSVASASNNWLTSLVAAADAAVKKYCKRDLELTAYVEYYNGYNKQDMVIRQYPILLGQTTVAAGSNGAALPQATINVASTAGFHPGPANDDGDGPSITVQTSLSTWTTVLYTGVTATTFTGCSGGTGTMVTGYTVSSPSVAFNPQGYGGQAPSAFGDGNLMVLGTQYMVTNDAGGKKSNRGLLRRIGGGVGVASIGFFPSTYMGGGGKLGGFGLPTWPLCDGGYKIRYSAGYSPVPEDLKYATGMLVAYMVRNMPTGSPLSSENLGSYSYSVLSMNKDIPEIGSIQRTLAPYREISFGLP